MFRKWVNLTKQIFYSRIIIYPKKSGILLDNHHIFDSKNIEILESEDRNNWQNREEIISMLKLKKKQFCS